MTYVLLAVGGVFVGVLLGIGAVYLWVRREFHKDW